MTDQYQAFTQSPLGKFVVKNLGLPSPVSLDRFESGQPVVNGAVLLGAAPSSTISASIAQVLSNIHADSYVGNNVELQQTAAKVGLNLRPLNADDKESKFKAVVFDASGIQNSEQLKELYNFFNPIARQISTSGRVIVIGTTPETAKTVKQAIAQRALEGFIKSVGKEFKKGITAQVVYVDQGAEANLESTLRFLISPRSAYVSGQVIRISKAEIVKLDWAKPLAGKTALVTGASRGIGEAIAQVLARDGAHVICLDVPQQQADLERVAGSIGGSVLAIDITAADAGEKIKTAAAKQGGLDVIVHNAGITRDGLMMRMTEQQWDMVINVNLKSAFNFVHAITPVMMKQKSGSIINMSSVVGVSGNAGQCNYSASKAGMIGLAKSIAKEVGSRGIRANCIAPGFIITEMTAVLTEEVKAEWAKNIPLRRGGTPEDVANVATFLASDLSSYVSGQVIHVCGGMNM